MKRFSKALLLATCICLLAGMMAAASAMATRTVLCSINEEVCAKENTYSSEFGLELTGYVGWEGTSRELELPGVATLTCVSGKLGTQLKEQEEGPMTGEVNRWTFDTPCAPTGCTIKPSPAEAPMGYPAELEAVGGGDGVLRISEPVLIATCNQFPLFFQCAYTTEMMEVEVEGGGEKGGEHAYLSTEAPLARVGGWGFNCAASTAVFRSHYEVYEPASAVYVTH